MSAPQQSLRSPIEDLVVSGLDDWIYESLAFPQSLDASLGHKVRRAGALGLIAEAIFGGLMVPGDVVGRDHIPWTTSLSASFERIARKWITEWDEAWPTPGSIVWLDNTPEGDALARAVLEREGS